MVLPPGVPLPLVFFVVVFDWVLLSIRCMFHLQTNCWLFYLLTKSVEMFVSCHSNLGLSILELACVAYVVLAVKVRFS